MVNWKDKIESLKHRRITRRHTLFAFGYSLVISTILW